MSRYGMNFPPNNRMWYERPIGTGYALSLAGGTMEGPIYLWREPRFPSEAASKAYVDFAVGNTGGPFISINGGQMRGPLLLNQDPVGRSEAATKNYVDRTVRLAILEFDRDFATKQYVDDAVKAALAELDLGDLAGLATKQYVDDAIADLVLTGGGIGEAPTDGRHYIRQGSTQSWVAVPPVIDTGSY